MPVLLMLDVMLDLMLDRVHAMTHVALRASFDDDVSNWFACARGKQTRQRSPCLPRAGSQVNYQSARRSWRDGFAVS
jgi:hypothetical protein